MCDEINQDDFDQLTEADYEAARQAYDDGTIARQEEEYRKEFDALCVKAREKAELALESACQKDPSIAALRSHKWLYAEAFTVMAISTDDILICPDSVMTMDFARVEVILRHEWGHVVLGHGERGKAFVAKVNDPDNAKIWKSAFNCGADLEINSGLIQEIVAAGLRDECFLPGYGSCTAFPPGLKAEEYARLVMADQDLVHAMEWHALAVMKPKTADPA